MNEEELIVKSILQLLKTGFNSKLDKHDADNICERIPSEAITVWDYQESLRNYKAILLLAAESRTKGQHGDHLFTDLMINANILFRWINNKNQYYQETRYRSALVDLIAENYKSIFGTRKFTIESTGLDAISLEDQGDWLLSGIKFTTGIRLGRLGV